ncbi:hypothetical protein HK104_006892 [Borealophlyctis nickersoniae]|nr:hypothetical protein HK104_006892 [Borealophlyctis nickersoniae]
MPLKVTVLGGGVVGLTTAILLRANGHKVTIVARAFPDNWDEDIQYTSPAAGAHWRSFATNDDLRLQEWESTTFRVLKQLTEVPEAGVQMTDAIEFGANAEQAVSNAPWFHHLVPDFITLSADELPPRMVWGVRYRTTCINVPKYLQWLLSSFRSLGGVTEVRDVRHLDDLLGDDVDAVVNCTGVGARVLGGLEDQNVYPTRGQTVVVRAPKVRRTVTQLGAPEDFTYVIPRDDGTVVLGGTYQENDSCLTPDPTTSEKIIERCLSVCPELRSANGSVDIIAHKVGLRPTRVGGVRCETELRAGHKVILVHNYGHGGYGFQTSIGCANTVLELIDSAWKSSVQTKQQTSLATPLPALSQRTITFPDNSSASPAQPTQVKICEYLSPEHGSHIWPSSLVLASYLFANPSLVRNARILELGCGTAVPGLLSALMGAQRVVLTDLPDSEMVLSAVREAAMLNGVEDRVEVRGLRWGQFPEDILPAGLRILMQRSAAEDLAWLSEPFDLILGADVFYEPSMFDNLLATVAYVLDRAPANACFLTAYHERSSRRSIQHLLDKWGLKCGTIKREEYESVLDDLVVERMPDVATEMVFLLAIEKQ